MLHDCSGKLEMDHGADSDSLMGLPPRDTNKPCVCCNAETNCGQNQETVCYRTISPTIANFWWAFENTPRTNLHVDCELINMLLLFFSEESILLQDAETPADGGFVNRSFFRGMDVTILAQETVLYCAYATRHPWCPALQQYPLPSTHSAGPGLQGTTRDPASNSNSPGHRPAGQPPVATQRQPPRNCPTPTAVGPTWGGPTIGRHSDERNARHGQLLTLLLSGPPHRTDPLSEN